MLPVMRWSFVAGLVALAIAPSASAGSRTAGACDGATMRGVHAVHLAGRLLGQPLAVVGHVNFKRAGRLSGIATEVLAGQPERYAFTGTYSLDADCRGELSFKVARPVPHQRTFAFRPKAGGRRTSIVLRRAQIDGLKADEGQDLLANSAIILSGTSERLSRRPMTCNQASARGAYVYDATGVTAPFGLVTFTFAGVAEIDGRGGVSIHSVGTMPHAVDRDAHYTGTYSIEPSCRGEMRVSGEHFDIRDNHIGHFYAAAGGKAVYMIFTRSWVDEFLGINLNPLGLNEALSHGQEQEFSYTFSGVAERR